MATYKIFISDEEVEKKYLGINSYYTYLDGYLRIYNKGKMVYFLQPKKGDAFIVKCLVGKAFLKKMVPPLRNSNSIAWLIGFHKYNRAWNDEDYEKRLEERRKRHYWDGYEEWEYKSDGYRFTLCNSEFDSNHRNVVGYIKDTITKEEIIELIPFMIYHPSWYVQKLLYERYGITEEEFNDAYKNIA